MTWAQVVLVAFLIIWGWFGRERKLIDTTLWDLMIVILAVYSLFTLAAIDVVSTALEIFAEVLLTPTGKIG